MGNLPLNSLNFNIAHGYLEGIVRGFKMGMLKQSDYMNLAQSETLEDLKTQMCNTEFGAFMVTQGGGEAEPVTVSFFDEKMRDKMLVEFDYIRSHAVWPLSEFLAYLTYGHMIDNVMLLVTGGLNQMAISDLLPKCHPMGSFDGMAAVQIASTVEELYSAILIDTPIAKLDSMCKGVVISSNGGAVRKVIAICIKAYLEDFKEFCKSMGNETAELMGEFLGCDCDRRAFMITINSLGTTISQELRMSLLPTCGKLYPEGLGTLAKCDDYDRVRALGELYPIFKPMFEESGDNTGSKTLEDMFAQYEVNLLKSGFMGQFHFAVFYAYFKLREYEIRNVVWIAECVAQHAKNRIDNYIPIW